ncbi:hypothetical protein GCM10025868_11540 [Angustibacter aerolatus]|uniref:Uncharacterized protein n=1 Tax=Angustibacter aerolatus TaxID=1162965 RepID=A0ABQ6JDM6_9ACTN|nr:hypothetical protein GCM10025868_11540 [Angustibacter aerolatus]
MLVVYRDGIPVFGQPGAVPQPALEDLLKQVREPRHGRREGRVRPAARRGPAAAGAAGAQRPLGDGPDRLLSTSVAG